MPLMKLSRDELATSPGGKRGANPEYVRFLQSLRIGEGGAALVADEGATRQTLKNRLNAAAKAAGVSVKYHRSGADQVRFELVEAGSLPRGRGRPRKDATA